MKSLLLIAPFFLLSFINAQARIKIPFGEKQVLTQVADLPDIEEYSIGKKGKYMDLARLHTEYNVAFMPLWIVKKPVFVGYNAKDESYIELSDEQLNTVLQKNNLQKENLLKLGFFSRFGGKLIALCLLSMIMYGILPSKKKEVKPVIV